MRCARGGCGSPQKSATMLNQLLSVSVGGVAAASSSGEFGSHAGQSMKEEANFDRRGGRNSAPSLRGIERVEVLKTGLDLKR